MNTDPIDNVYRALVRLIDFSQTPLLLLAVSGGADSVFMLHALSRLKASLSCRLAVVTVEHGLRTSGESAADASFVENLCASFSPPISCYRCDLPSGEVMRLASVRKRGIEEAARYCRYRAFEETAERIHASWILTAHTADDQRETLLMRLLQGSGGASLRGIASIRGRYLRPLLGVSRGHIEAWLTDTGTPWREDSSNRDSRFYRNRVRNTLIPLLRAEFPGWERGLDSLSQKAAIDEDYIREEPLPAWTVQADGLSCDRASFVNLHPARAIRFLHQGLCRLSIPNRVSFRFVSRILREGKTLDEGRSIQGSALSFSRQGEFLFLRPYIVKNEKSGYLVYIRGSAQVQLPYGIMDVCLCDGSVCIDGRFGPFSVPLIVRSRRPADRVQTADGTSKTIKKLLNSWGVPEDVRDMLPVIEQAGIIRAVLGSPLGYQDWLVRS
ncbi:MAG: tRNA lysidine(34) synthetase TilS [Spirochaetales bacterium]|nr:tRNA lysidine(34) synthetase TilS [Spirochaetales bacterium]